MKDKIYDLYGIECKHINFAKKLVENILEVELKAHESGYHCGEYFRSSAIDIDDENFILQKNYDEFEEEWTEEDYSQYPFLLYVNDTFRSDKILSLFSKDDQVTLLSHKII